MQWRTIFRKEMLEYWRNFSWVWVPIVFIILAIMDPLTTYYMPIILDKVGGLPEGAVFEMPDITAVDAFMMSLSEYSMFGVLVIVLITMGTIAGERKSGVVELILVKPVHYATYITSKWAAKLTVILASTCIGLLTSWYYINLLFGDISFISVIEAIAFYSLWFMLVVTITMFFNCLFKSSGIVFGASIGTLLSLSAIYRVFSHKLTWFPNSLSGHIGEMLQTDTISNTLWGASFVTILCIIVILFISVLIFRKKELA
ncbi:putative transmembrane protein YxlG [Paraliobacillus sp. PM-2]|uniref:ABC transporter permease n=1 Tax=Paraliobacillus sp. PM-2 TaxID=1462524 RepID=UPI00061BF860|nr:ABC transporter permease subunit [Paraliobacillus sp. PM-2]CQR47260.1 putative transmembrane protein YxlG [Paraliobacillus sp. PM-2]